MNMKLALLPKSILEIIWMHCVSLYTKGLHLIHQELKRTDLSLHLSETLFPFEVDFEHVMRLPRLLPPSESYDG